MVYGLRAAKKKRLAQFSRQSITLMRQREVFFYPSNGCIRYLRHQTIGDGCTASSLSICMVNLIVLFGYLSLWQIPFLFLPTHPHMHSFLSNDQHSCLLKLICETATLPTVRRRAAVLLLSHRSESGQGIQIPIREVAEKAGCSIWLVTNTRRRFAVGGIQAALASPSGSVTPCF